MDRAAGNPVLWRCRRGMKELDLILERYARGEYPTATPQRRRAFERLLDLPDPLLLDLLIASGRAAAPDPASTTQGSAGACDPSADDDLAAMAALVAAAGRR